MSMLLLFPCLNSLFSLLQGVNARLIPLESAPVVSLLARGDLHPDTLSYLVPPAAVTVCFR